MHSPTAPEWHNMRIMQQQHTHAQAPQAYTLRLPHILNEQRSRGINRNGDITPTITMPTKEEAINNLRTVLSKYVPASALDRLVDYIIVHGVHLKITRSRNSKYGDYRHPRIGQPYHAISINGDLSPHFFLAVLLHEMAHLEAYLKYRKKIKPHGIEWQSLYRDFLIRYSDAMPCEAQPLLKQYVSRLPLSPSVGRKLDTFLKDYGRPSDNAGTQTIKTPRLDDLHPGDSFRLIKKGNSVFIALERKRTRWLCREQSTNRLYSVSGTAEVIPIK